MSGLDAYSRHKCAFLVCSCACAPKGASERPDANALGDTPALANVPALASKNCSARDAPDPC
jgi:hypothetical protein